MIISKKIKDEILKNIDEQNVRFVFPTAVDANSWAEWVLNENIKSAIPQEKFIAWDTFKSSFFKDETQLSKDAKPIPSIMRKIFIQLLLKENEQNEIFCSIIKPEFKQNAYCFTNWLSKILPELNIWKEKISIQDSEDRDYQLLYERYCAFLDQNNLFEQSWTKCEFNAEKELKFKLFFPEILQDYDEWKEIFAKNQNQIQVITLTNEEWQMAAPPKATKYQDARSELRKTGLKIRNLVAQKKANWDEIALIVPELPTYTPYIEREFEKYNIPFVVRQGKNLTQNCSGIIFEQINDCLNSNFTYDAVRSLLQNEFIPWKQNSIKSSLIELGCEYRCICQLETEKGIKIDSWESSLEKAGKTEELAFYKELKSKTLAFKEAKTFAQIRKAWGSFKQEFFDYEKLSSKQFETQNKILARAVTLLNDLCKIEQDFTDEIFEFCNADNQKMEFGLKKPYEFFLCELKETLYKTQEKINGVSVFPFRMAPLANFKFTFLINANQKAVQVKYDKLQFLTSTKREKYGISEQNVTEKFLLLYSMAQSQVSAGAGCKTIDESQVSADFDAENVTFSYAENAFTGFAIPHSFLDLYEPFKDFSKCKPSAKTECEKKLFAFENILDKQDFFVQEAKCFLGLTAVSPKTDAALDQAATVSPKTKITIGQKNEFEQWKSKNFECTTEELCPNAKARIEQALSKNEKGKIRISATQMKNFFPCPRKWLLQNAVKLREDSLDTNLQKQFDNGNIYHGTLEDFFKNEYFASKPLPTTSENGTFSQEIEEKFSSMLKESFFRAIYKQRDFKFSSLFLAAISSQADSFCQYLLSFLHFFCAQEEPKGNQKGFQGFGGWFVFANEKELSSEHENYNLFGKLDLLLSREKDSAKNLVIIDFKTYSTVKVLNKDNEAIMENFQMPQYFKLVNENFENAEIEAGHFWKIQDKKDSNLVVKHLDNKENQSAMLNFKQKEISVFDNYCENFVEKVQKMDFEPISTKNTANIFRVDKFVDCAECNLKTICRYSFTIGQKEMKKEN